MHTAFEACFGVLSGPVRGATCVSKQTWEIGRFSMETRRYVGKREEKITTKSEKLVNLLCFVNEFPKTKW